MSTKKKIVHTRRKSKLVYSTDSPAPALSVKREQSIIQTWLVHDFCKINYEERRQK